MFYSKKLFLSSALSLILLGSSCMKYSTIDNVNSIDSIFLKSIHYSIKSDFQKIAITNSTSFSSILPVNFEADYLYNVNYVNQHGLTQFLNNYGITTNIIKAFDYYIQNSNQESVFQDLIDLNFINNEKEAIFFFNTVELSQLIESSLSNPKFLNTFQSNSSRISWGCGLAIASTVGCTIGFIFATGGSALLFAGAMKVLATAALIEACGEGWGNIN